MKNWVIAASCAVRAVSAWAENAVDWTVPKAYTNAAGAVFRYRWAEPTSAEPGKRWGE